MVSKSSVLGAAGEHYVMCQLLRRGLIAALAPAGVPLADIVVTDDIGDRLCAIQVKSRNDIGSDGGWHMKDKHETIESDTLFYAFVDFGKDTTAAPVCYIVPAPRDSGNNMGRLARTGIWDQDVKRLVSEERISGIPLAAWGAFLAAFKESTSLEKLMAAIRRIARGRGVGDATQAEAFEKIAEALGDIAGIAPEA